MLVLNWVEGFMNFSWKRPFKLERETKRLLGLDIGSSQAKLIELRKNGNSYRVTSAGIAKIAASEENNDDKTVTTVRAIRECLRSAGTQTRMAVCGVSGPEVAVRYFKFPSLPSEEIEGAVLLEAAQVCPFNVDDGAVDYQLMGDERNNVSGVLVAATNKLIKRKRQLTEDASLSCVLMDVDGLALLNCFNGFDHNGYEKGKAGRTTAILNVGSSYTTLGIVGDNGLPFIRDMAYAGDGIVERIATDNGIPTERVRGILSGENGGESEPELGDSLERACQKLIVDVAETLRYYAAQEKTAAVERVFVCGGFALVKGFVELLDKWLPTKAVLWNPFDKVRCNGGQPCEDTLAKQGPAMAVAAGLAMRSI